MRLHTFEHNGTRKIGAERAGELVELEQVAPDMLTFLRGGAAMLQSVERALQSNSATTLPLLQTKLCAPIPRPGKILCGGLNYKSHVHENPTAVLPSEPDLFAKVPSCVIGPGDAIVIPPMSQQVDYEVELAIVIGKTMHMTPRAQVMEHVFGYTILNDVSARDVQFKPNGRMRGKNFDTFAPLGPCIVTRDEIPEPNALRLQTKVNDTVLQDGSTRDWVFPPEELLSYLSSIMTLEPGDVVSTGTPAGVGYFRQPQVFLRAGDVCVLEIEKIGTLSNPVVEYSA